MYGFGDEKGLLSNAVEYIFGALNNKKIVISAIEVKGDGYFDLLTGTHKQITTSKDAEKKSIHSVDEFDINLSSVLKIRTQKATDQNATSSRSHLMFELQVEGERALMAFIDLAGWENPEGKDIQETKFINRTLYGFNTILSKITNDEVVTFDTKLDKLFKPFLSGTGEVFMLYHLRNSTAKKGLELIKNVVAGLKNVKPLKRPALKDISNIQSKVSR